MRKTLIAIVLLAQCLLSAQVEQVAYAEAANEFMALYNNGNYEAIFERFDADMRKALPRERTLRYFRQQVSDIMGNITRMEFYGLKRGAHLYRTVFDRAVADVLISLNTRNEINGLYISPPKSVEVPILYRNTTRMALPFEGEWFVLWGGTTLEDNYHVAEVSGQYAYDLTKVVDGSTHRGDPFLNDSYFAFGQEILAPCDARVVQVIYGVPDNVPGETNPRRPTGNTVVLRTPLDEYLLFAHLMEGSITVEEGQQVFQGEVIARCGNSGDSPEPHLHLSLQNDADLDRSTGARLLFDRILVNGEEELDYLPVREDSISNIYAP